MSKIKGINPITKRFTSNRIFRQFLAVFSGFCCQFVVGQSFSWISPALIKLQNDDSHIPLSPSQGSTLASIFVVGGIVSPILYSVMVDIFGRRWMMFVGVLFHIINWTIVYFSTKFYELLIARIVFGFALGYSYGLLPTYMGEVTEVHTRSTFGVVTSVLLSLGVIFEYSVGPYVSFKTLALLNLIAPVMALFGVLVMPESPYHLVRQKRYKEAFENLMWLRGDTPYEKIEEEMIHIEEFVAASPKKPLHEVLKEFTIPINRRAIILLTLLMFGQQFNASATVKSYFHIIINETNTPLDTDLAVIVVETSGLVVMIFSFFMVNRVGRKFLFLLTSIGCVIGTFVAGLYFMLVSQGIVGNEASYMVLGALLCIQIFNGFGAATVPTLIVSEMTTASVRSWFGACKTITLSIFNAMTVKIFQTIKDDLGAEYGFWMYTVITIVVIIVLIFIMPETRGKTLQEIQNMLSKNNKKQNKNSTIVSDDALKT